METLVQDRPRLSTLDLILLLGFLAVYTWCFVTYCFLQVAPLPWDEAYLHYLPTAVVTALEDRGVMGAIDALCHTHYSKPPLCGLGTMPAMLLFGDGPLSVRLDNLLMVFLAVFLLLEFFRQYMHPALAVAFAVAVPVSPYALMFSRSELAEHYLWTTTLLYVVVLHRTRVFADRRQSVYLGVALGLGMLSKVSFAMVAIGPTLWVVGSAICRRSHRQTLGLRAKNGLLALGVGLLICLPIYLANLKPIWAHVMTQYNLDITDYDFGDPHTWQFLTTYARAWQMYFGDLWMILLVLAALLTPFALWRSASLRALPWGLLGTGFLVNLVYCYHHPVFDMRFTLGSFLMAQLLIGLVLGSALSRLRRGQATIGRLLLLPLLLLLLSNSFLPNRERILCAEHRDIPVVGPVPGVVRLEAPCRDLRDDVLSRVRLPESGGFGISVAGDHRHLNSNNLDLTICKRRLPCGVLQLGYLDQSLDAEGRIRHKMARGHLAYVSVLKTSVGGDVSPYHRHAAALEDLFRANPHIFRPLPWVAALGDGFQVRMYEPVGELDESLIVPGKHQVCGFTEIWAPAVAETPPSIVLGDPRTVHWRGEAEQEPEDPAPDAIQALWSNQVESPFEKVITIDPLLVKAELYGVTLDLQLLDVARTAAEGRLWLEGPGFAVAVPRLRGRHVRAMVVRTPDHDGLDKLVLRATGMSARLVVRQIALEPVRPAYRDFGRCVLGAGEQVLEGEYRFDTKSLRDAPARLLHAHAATLEDGRWRLEPGQWLVLRFDTGQMVMQDGRLQVGDGEGLEIDVSADASSWHRLTSTEAGFVVTPELLPAKKIFVRIANGTNKATPALDLSFRARVDAPEGFRAVGGTTYRLAGR